MAPRIAAWCKLCNKSFSYSWFTDVSPRIHPEKTLIKGEVYGICPECRKRIKRIKEIRELSNDSNI